MREFMRRVPVNNELAELLRQAALMPEMTPAEKRAQRISFAYGNVSLHNPDITKDMVERIHDEMYGPERTRRK